MQQRKFSLNWYQSYKDIKTSQTLSPGQPAVDDQAKLSDIINEFIQNVGMDMMNYSLNAIMHETQTLPAMKHASDRIAAEISRAEELRDETTSMLQGISAEIAHHMLSDAAEGAVTRGVGAGLNINSFPGIPEKLQKWLEIKATLPSG
jgi:D-aminopeptidase